MPAGGNCINGLSACLPIRNRINCRIAVNRTNLRRNSTSFASKEESAGEKREFDFCKTVKEAVYNESYD